MATLSNKRSDPGRQLTRRRLWVVGIALFVIVDIALVALALNRPEASIPDALRTPTFSSFPTLEPTPEPEPPAERLATVRIVNPTRVLEARDAALAWRTTTGPCPGAVASLERTVDSGATWKPTNATAPTGVVSIQSVAIEGPDAASMIGQLASDCSTSLIRTYVAGDDYERYPADLGGAWFVHPLDHAIVHSPAGDFAAPCENVMAFGAIDGDRAAVLCNGQTVHVTTDAARSWSTAVSVPGAMNVTESASGYLVATVSTDPTCVGVQLLELPAALPEPVEELAPVGCFPAPQAPESLAGNIAVSVAAGTIWLWAGDLMSRSEDGGLSWV